MPAVQDYVDLLFSLGLLQIITRPTRCSANSATLIDHAILNPKSAACESAIITSKISDHFPIIYICDTFRCSRVEKQLLLEITPNKTSSVLKRQSTIILGTLCLTKRTPRRHSMTLAVHCHIYMMFSFLSKPNASIVILTALRNG